MPRAVSQSFNESASRPGDETGHAGDAATVYHSSETGPPLLFDEKDCLPSENACAAVGRLRNNAERGVSALFFRVGDGGRNENLIDGRGREGMAHTRSKRGGRRNEQLQ